MIKHIIFLFMPLLSYIVMAKPDLPPYQEAGGFSYRPTVISENNPSKVRPLFYDLKKIDSASAVTNHPSNMALLIIKDGKVLHESYNHPVANENSLFFSMSMSKSLTAYSLAGLICSKKVELDKTIGDYTDELRGTTWDTASIRDVLRMSSGARIPVVSGQIEKGSFKKATTHIDSVNSIMLRNGKRESEPGKMFNYLSVDTSAIERVIASVTKKMNMLDEFNTQVWSQVGAEREGKWNIDKAGALHAYAGFSATLRDWGRLGLWSLEKNKEETCEGLWHREANSKQITNHKLRQGKAFDNYGYQVWIRNNHQYWWVGYGGQRVGIDTRKNAIIVAFSHTQDYMSKLYKLMDSL